MPRPTRHLSGRLALALVLALCGLACTGPARAGEATAGDPSKVALGLVNQQRRQAGCGPLTPDRRLDSLAQAYSDEMADRGFFDHTDPDGRTPWDRARDASISYLGGENIARGQATPQAVVTAWMESPGHRANLLDCHFRTLGTGLRHGPGGPWWTQEFGYQPR